MQQEGIERVVFYGVSEEMEVAYITLQGVDIRLDGIVEDDENFHPRFIFGYELERLSRIQALKPQGVLITTLAESDRKRERLKAFLGGQSICIKDICIS